MIYQLYIGKQQHFSKEAPSYRYQMRQIGKLELFFFLMISLACDGSDNTSVTSHEVGDGGVIYDLPPSKTPVLPPGDCSLLEGVVEVNQEKYLASGTEIILRLLWPDENPDLFADYAHCIKLTTANDESMKDAAVSRRHIENLRTALLVAPGSDSEENRAVLDGIKYFITSRPENEPIAVFRWVERLTQVSTFQTGRRLLGTLMERGIQPYRGEHLPVAQAVSEMQKLLRKIPGPAVATISNLVVLAPTMQFRGSPGIDLRKSTIEQFWIADGFSGQWMEALPQGWRFVVPQLQDLPHTLNSVSQQIDRYIDSSYYGLGICGDGESHDLRLRIDNRIDLDLVITRNLREELIGDCDPARIAQGRREYPAKIAFVFDAAQRDVYDQRISDRDKEDFSVSVGVWPDNETISSQAHLRGSSSMKCVRKCFTLNLGGTVPRFLIPGSAIDKFSLLSLCLDEFYIQTSTAYRIMSDLGLFPLKQRYIELLVDDRSLGAYLFMEHITDYLRGEVTGITSIIRRRQDQAGKEPEVKWARGSTEQALANYQGILTSTEGLSGIELEQALSRRMNLDQYLRWIGLMTLLHNGDYVDEVYFYSTDITDEDGSIVDFFSIVGWDPDDLFADCHHDDEQVINDPNGLLFCTESLLDRVIFADSHLYQRYLSVLEEVLVTVTDQVFRAALDASLAELLPYLSESDIYSAMTEIRELDPLADSQSGVIERIRARSDQMMELFSMRRKQFMAKIDEIRQP